MAVEQLLVRILREPSPEDLWDLHPHLLAMEGADAEAARDLSRTFYNYLAEVKSKLTSQQYSSLAAKLQVGTVGAITGQDIVEALISGNPRAISELLTGGLAAVLETVSNFQHVKAWETEFSSTHTAAVWELYAVLWHISAEMQPDLPLEKRQALINELLAPARNPDLENGVRLAVIIRLFQLLLAIRLVPLVSRMTQMAQPEPASQENM
jgi:hypothetical protein